jgi:hypothetical protein
MMVSSHRDRFELCTLSLRHHLQGEFGATADRSLALSVGGSDNQTFFLSN